MASSQCQVQVSVNGGAWQSGGVVAVPFGATIALRNIVPSARSYTWELPDYGPVMAVPTNWQSVGGVYTSYAASPASFAIPASGPNAWGKYPIRLRINGNPLEYEPDGSLNPAFDGDWTDEATILSVPSPTMQMPGFCFGEAGQFDSLRSWAGSIMANLRAMDAFAATLGGTTAWFVITHTSNNGATLATAQTNVLIDTSGGAAACVFPAAPADGLRIRFKDPAGTWQTTTPTVTGNAGQKVENPASPGTYSAAAGTQNLPASKGDAQDFEWSQTYSTWFLV